MMMATTVDDLIDLKDLAVSCAHTTVEAILSVWGENPGGVIGDVLDQARGVTEAAELYDAAEDSDAVSIEDHERRVLADKVEAIGFPSVADDLREGIAPETVISRLDDIGETDCELRALLGEVA